MEKVSIENKELEGLNMEGGERNATVADLFSLLCDNIPPEGITVGEMDLRADIKNALDEDEDEIELDKVAVQYLFNLFAQTRFPKVIPSLQELSKDIRKVL